MELILFLCCLLCLLLRPHYSPLLIVLESALTHITDSGRVPASCWRWAKGGSRGSACKAQGGPLLLGRGSPGRQPLLLPEPQASKTAACRCGRALLPSAPGKTQRALNNPNSSWPAGFQSPWPCCQPHLQGQCTAPGARAAAWVTFMGGAQASLPVTQPWFSLGFLLPAHRSSLWHLPSCFHLLTSTGHAGCSRGSGQGGLYPRGPHCSSFPRLVGSVCLEAASLCSLGAYETFSWSSEFNDFPQHGLWSAQQSWLGAGGLEGWVFMC